MCQATEDDLSGVLNLKPDFKNFRKCLKCDKNSVIVTRINEALCRECFTEYFTHKFRATIGKNKLLNKNEEVIFAYSGSGSSVAMLNLIVQGTSETAYLKKKFTFKPTILFIEDHVLFEKSENNEIRKKFIQKFLKSVEYAGFDVYFSLIENSIQDGEPSFYKNLDDVDLNTERCTQFVNFINDIKNDTSREEMIKRLRIQLISKIATEIKIIKVILGLNCSKLTVDLLSNVAMGKGAHISSEMSLEEKHNDITFLRPLREVTAKEIAFYNHISDKSDSIMSSNTSTLNLPNSSIYRLTEKFINGVQNNFPTTVATIFRTSDKLVPFESSELNVKTFCKLCLGTIDTNNNIGLASSAVNDLIFSKSISKINSNGETDLFDTSLYCYSCIITINDVTDKNKLPKNLMSMNEMKSEIQDFLIES